MCVSETCNRGYYRDVLPPERANVSVVGDLMFGSDVCVPCDELCEECTGPGPMLEATACQVCSRATQLQELQCVEECNTDREFTNSACRNDNYSLYSKSFSFMNVFDFQSILMRLGACRVPLHVAIVPDLLIESV